MDPTFVGELLTIRLALLIASTQRDAENVVCCIILWALSKMVRFLRLDLPLCSRVSVVVSCLAMPRCAQKSLKLLKKVF